MFLVRPLGKPVRSGGGKDAGCFWFVGEGVVSDPSVGRDVRNDLSLGCTLQHIDRLIVKY